MNKYVYFHIDIISDNPPVVEAFITVLLSNDFKSKSTFEERADNFSNDLTTDSTPSIFLVANKSDLLALTNALSNSNLIK